jgi:formate hydrogenlyase subunit 3/multisubunit Na+/H+ antiporter MnhD subunit
MFRLDALNSFVAGAIGLFFLLTLIYSFGFMRGKKRLIEYYAYIVLTFAASLGVVLADNLIWLLGLWGFLGLTLYLLISLGSDTSGAVAKKTLIMVGGSDALMILGIGLVYVLSGTWQMHQVRLQLNNGLAVLAYICIALACFAKAGAMPLHSWIPACAESAPLPVVAYLPASLDKLLGIYLLARASLDLFVMNSAANIFLMATGAVTIIAAVMMAMVQHNLKRLLGYHAVSQVGYMVLGIGTGLPVGIAGGLFHMLNNAIYKACLFLTAGNVEHKTGTVDLDKLGGLAKVMPLTYISTLIASIAISGIPPFNGFFSKWMIYQGLIEQLRITNYALRITVVFCLVAAMFGSGLTLASFMKLLHAVFLGQPANRQTGRPANEVSPTMWLPCVLLASLCVIFGIFATQIPLRYFILPAIGSVTYIGAWFAGLSTLFIVIALVLGLIALNLKGLKPALRQDSVFCGGEALDFSQNRVSGTDFYLTVKEYGILKAVYKKAESGFFDLYEQAKVLVFAVGRFFQYLHNGILPTYIVWTLLGMIVLFFVLVR